MELRKKISQVMTAAVVIVLVTIFSLAIYTMGIRAENIFLVYMFGVVIIIIETQRYEVGIVSSLVMVAAFNYFFTEPRFTFRMNDKNYIASFVIFLVVAMIVTSLTVKIQKQLVELEKMQKYTDTMYRVSRGYLNVSGVRQAAKYGVECLEHIRSGTYIIFVDSRKEGRRIPYSNLEEDGEQIPEEVLKASEWCFRQSVRCGAGTEDYPNLDWQLLPIISKGVTYGVLAVRGRKESLPDGVQNTMEAVLSLIAIAMDREFAGQAEHESRIASERERMRNNLLRSISHDLRTPLAGITGSASFLLESYEEIDKESRETLLRDITNDSAWLARMVDNLLNMTRIQEGRLKLHYADEVVDDIVSEVNSRVQRRLGERIFQIEMPEGECLSVPMDGQLIIQVLVNMVENSIKHTAEDGHIRLAVSCVKLEARQNLSYVRFAVVDDGSGIPQEIQEHMFDSFVTSDTQKGADRGRGMGMGLGLSIASEIIKFHNGMIGSYNNETKGATVYFLLPLERSK